MTDRSAGSGCSGHARHITHRCSRLGTAAVASVLAALTCLAGAYAADVPAASDAQMFAAVDRIFADYALDAHIPGLVYGVVSNGRLVYVRGIGVQDLQSNRPVTADTLFRIASMTKASRPLTVLEAARRGQAAAGCARGDVYPVELRGWKYLTRDSPRIRVRDPPNHSAGFITDDPWGDRQTPMPEPEFSQLLREGVPFARTPETAMEYL
jgi:CubicO group peptidase (beta-lactamase class C family)